jgi:hypothetical protein
MAEAVGRMWYWMGMEVDLDEENEPGRDARMHHAPVVDQVSRLETIQLTMAIYLARIS